MATGNEYTTLTGLLKGIADALRAKIGTTAQINAQDFPSNIAGIPKAAGNASTSDVLSGVTFSNKNGGEQTGTMPNNGSISKSISPGDSCTVPAGYHNGSGTVSANMPSGDASASDVLSGKTFSNIWVNGATGTMTNRGAWSTTISPGGSVTIPAGYHSGGGRVSANTISPSSKIIARNTNYVVTVRSGDFINISSSVNVPSARISMIITGGVGVNDGGGQIGTTTVKATATNGTEYTCNYSNGCYFVPTDTTYTKVTVYHSNYGGSSMSHGIISPIIVFGY